MYREKKNLWKETWYTCYYLLFGFVCLRILHRRSAKNRNSIQICVNTTRNTLITRINFYWAHSMFCSFSSIFRYDYRSYELFWIIEQWTMNMFNRHSDPTYYHARYSSLFYWKFETEDRERYQCCQSIQLLLLSSLFSTQFTPEESANYINCNGWWSMNYLVSSR